MLQRLIVINFHPSGREIFGFRRRIVDTYHRCYRKSSSVNFILSPRKEVKVSVEVTYDNESHTVGKIINEDVVSRIKAHRTFLKNVPLRFILNVLKPFISSKIILLIDCTDFEQTTTMKK